MGNDGTHADAAVVTDSPGTKSSYLRGIVKLLADGITVVLSTVDIEIGAVENKDATTDARGKVRATESIAEGDIVIGVQAPVLGATADSGVVTDAVGSVSAKLRGLVTLILAMSAKLPTSLGIKAAAASLSTAMATEDAAKFVTPLVTALIAAGDMSGDLNGVVTMGAARRVHFQLESADSGSRVGDIYIQASDDGVTYYNLPLTNVLTGVVSSSIGVVTLTAVAETVEVDTAAAFVRVFFDFTSGIGSLNVWSSVKA